MRRKVYSLCCLLMITALLVGCSIRVAKARKPTEDLSRGLPLSQQATSTAAFAIQPGGESVHVIIPHENDFTYIQIDQAADPVSEQTLEIDLSSYFRAPKIVWSEEALHLIWAARDQTNEGWGLYYLMLDQDGRLLTEPALLSKGTRWVSRYEIIRDSEGGAYVVWEDRDAQDIRFIQLSSQGRALQPPQVLVSQGQDPSIRLDEQGSYHLIWLEGEQLMYQVSAFSDPMPIKGQQISTIRVRSGNTLNGPVLGVSEDWIYVFWSVLRQTGLEAGTAITQYLIFPAGQISAARPGQLNIFPNPEEKYQPFDGAVGLSQIVGPPAEDYLSTDYVFHPSTSSKPGQTLVVAVSANQEIRLDVNVQVLIGLFQDGEYLGYTVGTKTDQISKDAQVEVDRNGDLHLIWQDGVDRDQVFYATSSEAGRKNLDRIQFSDLGNLILSGGLEAVTGILLFPFAIPWILIGLLVMVAWRYFNNDEDVTQTVSVILLGICLLIYQVSKILFLPDILTYVPFSAWVDIPEKVGSFLRYAVPILIFAIGLITAEWRRRRAENPTSTLVFYLMIVLVDTVLTLAIYGVIFLGEY